MKHENEDDCATEATASPNRLKKIQITAFIIFVLIVATLIATLGGDLSIRAIIDKCASHKALVVVVLMLLFLLKSVTIFIPLDSLYLASGMIFDSLPAMLVSLCGLSIALTVPFFIGRWACDEEVSYLCNKYPKIKRIEEIQKNNQFVVVFIIRLIGGLPGDVLSFYFGANRIKYLTYMLASLCGYSVSLIMFTLLGDVILDPKSVEFVLLIVLRIAISVVTAIITYTVRRRKKHEYSNFSDS